MIATNHKGVGENLKATYCVDEIADMLGISKASAYRLVKKDYFRVVKIGTTIRISKVSFDTWLNSQTAERRTDYGVH